MVKTVRASINVAIVDYDASTREHVVELMKESLREQFEDLILEDTWEVRESKRLLYKNEDGVLETKDKDPVLEGFSDEMSEARETLEVMTVDLTANIVVFK